MPVVSHTTCACIIMHALLRCCRQRSVSTHRHHRFSDAREVLSSIQFPQTLHSSSRAYHFVEKMIGWRGWQPSARSLYFVLACCTFSCRHAVDPPLPPPPPAPHFALKIYYFLFQRSFFGSEFSFDPILSIDKIECCAALFCQHGNTAADTPPALICRLFLNSTIVKAAVPLSFPRRERSKTSPLRFSSVFFLLSFLFAGTMM